MTTVTLYVYDLSQGMAKTMSPMLLGKQINGVWHTSIVVYGNEYFFGSGGIQDCVPKTTVLGPPLQMIIQGETQVPLELFESYLYELGSSTFQGSKYNIIKHNCNNFSNEVSQFLTGKSIPQYILDLPKEVLSTELGRMLIPVLERYSDQISNVDGHHFNSFTRSTSNSPTSNHTNQRNNHSSSIAETYNLVKVTERSEISDISDEEMTLLNKFDNPTSETFKELDTIALTNSTLSERQVELILESLFRNTMTESFFKQFNSAVYHIMALLQRLCSANSSSKILFIASKIAINGLVELVQTPVQTHGCILELIRKLCSNNDDEQIIFLCASLCLNFAVLKKSDESLGFELGCFLVDTLSNCQQLTSPSALIFIQALYILCQSSNQLIQLSVIQGVDVSSVVQQSVFAAKLQDSIDYTRKSMQ